jgi:hypothetical protein
MKKMMPFEARTIYAICVSRPGHPILNTCEFTILTINCPLFSFISDGIFHTCLNLLVFIIIIILQGVRTRNRQRIFGSALLDI